MPKQSYLLAIMRNFLCVCGGLALVGATALIAYIAVAQSRGNFDEVLSGEVYRSAQPSPEQLTRYVSDSHIRSVVNLRGSDPGSPWYDNELFKSAELGLKHYDFPMSASHLMTQTEAEALISLLKTVEKPVLIHCNWGADRTGLASALYLAAIAKSGEEEAESQISLRYGHFSIPVLSQAYPMDESFEILEPWLGYEGS
ncbi:MAG: Protein tyrosine/serine phosphatase [Devosia sp.]|nr:Protein tyrosine/serine phosphatase [Devosia sp.]